ncbi:MAG: hypothetical protein SAL70_21035 [Scytonema sp. PMC 1070.18]|nr:hypothetical protein [Scytonema sp. PMC 1070.18]
MLILSVKVRHRGQGGIVDQEDFLRKMVFLGFVDVANRTEFCPVFLPCNLHLVHLVHQV